MTQIQPHTALQWRLRDADRTLKLFITVFLFVLSVGYTIGLAFVDHTTSGTPQGMSEHFRGTPEEQEVAELKFAMSADEMYIFLHNHILSLSLVFFAVGGLFYFSSIVPPIAKLFLMIEPMVAIMTTFGGIWLVRFVSEYFSWLVLISGITMVGCYAIMVILMFIEMWWKR